MDTVAKRKQRGLVSGAMLAGLMLVTAVWLSNITEYGSGNDPNYNLGNAYTIDPADPFLHKLHDAAVANCPPAIGTGLAGLGLAVYVGGLVAASLVARLAVSQAVVQGLRDRLVRVPIIWLLATAIASVLLLIGCRLAFAASPIVWAAGTILFL